MTLDVSVVIGFRDWGVGRLELAVKSIQESFGKFSGEVIISDYGSLDSEPSRKLAEGLGAKYVYTETTGPWSRSSALNAGFMHSRGELLVSTDADMIFSPRSFERILEYSREAPNSAFFLQCRDLPEGFDDEWVAENSNAWDVMEQESRIRPRWGMGGLMAISRTGYDKIRGFDERLHTYGGEDIDFALRAKRAGYKTNWVEDPEVRMYHMWHPPTSRVVALTEEGREAVAYNKSIVYDDKTFVRNFRQWKYRPNWVRPLVSVAIATKNRSDLIVETIRSIQMQSVQDFEVVIVDDGGDDNLAELIKELSDDRLRYYWQEASGISAARNLAMDVSRGHYTAVIDDDDLMHPERLAWHFETLTEGLSGTVGSFVNFDDQTGELALHYSMYPAVRTAYEKGSAPGHGTWLIETDTLRKFRYDESITSGVDNNIMLRMLRAGVNIGHSGKPLTLRRMHPRQVTVTDTTKQVGAAENSLEFFKWNLTPHYEKRLAEERASANDYPTMADRESMNAEIKPFLPDHLISRDLLINESARAADIEWDGVLVVLTADSDTLYSFQCAVVAGATQKDMVVARMLGLEFEAIANDKSVDSAATRDCPVWLFPFLRDLSGQQENGLFVGLSREAIHGDWPVMNITSNSTLYSEWIAVPLGPDQVAHFLVDNPTAVLAGDAFWTC